MAPTFTFCNKFNTGVSRLVCSRVIAHNKVVSKRLRVSVEFIVSDHTLHRLLVRDAICFQKKLLLCPTGIWHMPCPLDQQQLIQVLWHILEYTK